MAGSAGAAPLMISCIAPRAVAEALSALWEEHAEAVSLFEISPQGDWRVEAIGVASAAVPEIHAAIALLSAAHGGSVPQPVIMPIPQRNWVAENQASFRPIRVGRFLVRPSHDLTRPPAGAHVLTVDASVAFGTGEHATTRGCLVVLDRLARRAGWQPRRMLDMGCGTGILAMAMARQWRRAVHAVDIDPDAVRVAAGNAQANGLAALIRPAVGATADRPPVAGAGPYDLIVANILARPLVTLAPGLARQLAPGGRIVLSGLLADQQPQVAAAYRRQGLRLASRLLIDGWATLLMTRRI
jgi:ribosomal protein L11 methyltransferase